ncbi:hypothetical protein quinque_010246 [Culex quinquefasciatus]
MGTVVCLPAGPELVSQCNRCATCLPKPFGKRGVSALSSAVPSSDSVYKLAEIRQSSDGTVTHRIVEEDELGIVQLKLVWKSYMKNG